jgi:prepilin-type N-terminal cleavage/methylation domain-containing protein
MALLPCRASHDLARYSQGGADVLRQDGTTLVELLTVVAIMGILAVVAVPGAAATRGAFAGDAGARKLALVLRAAQARAQARASIVRVTVAGDGGYVVVDVSAGGDPAAPVAAGELGAGVQTNFPGGALEFGPRGWPCLPGATSPRAGSFIVGTGSADSDVVVQLGGCVRCS